MLYAEDLPLPLPRRKPRNLVAVPGVRAMTQLGVAPVGVTVAARLVGVAPGTLRTWQRRYGLGPALHRAGTHRRYGPGDLARLELMHQGLLHGLSTAEAAHLALTTPGPDLDELAAPARVAAELGGGGRPARTGRTPILPMPGAGPGAAGLARAVLALDTVGACSVLGHQLEQVGPRRVWDEVVRPVMNAVAARWAATGHGVQVEHLLSEAVATAFAQSEMAAPAPVSAGTVLLAAVPGEHHYLPLRVLAAVLRHRGVAATVLGGDVPLAALSATIGRTGPRAVLLWAQLDPNADLDVLHQLPRTRPPAHCFVGGPGWADLELPPSVRWLADLAQAADSLTAAAT